MKRQIIGITAAVALAVIGTVALVSYVQSAKDDAVAGETLVEVYVVRDTIAKGTALGEMGDDVQLAEVPQRLVSPDAIVDLTQYDATLVAAVDLLEGEQLLAGRLVDARSLVRAAVPKGLQEVTIALSPERAVGGELVAGSTVGVIFSFEPFDVTAAAPAADPAAPSTTSPVGRTPNTTHLTLHKVLVTAVQFSVVDSTRAAEIQGEGDSSTATTVDPAVAEAPSEQLLVTLAVSPAEAEQLVFAAEFGTIWLTSENEDATEEGTRILTLEGVYVTVPR